MKELIEQRGQRLAVQLNPEITVTGDASLLGKAIGNLLSNAILYSPDGAEIRVWCGIRRDKPAFTIENTGVHIQDDALPHLFEAFIGMKTPETEVPAAADWDCIWYG